MNGLKCCAMALLAAVGPANASGFDKPVQTQVIKLPADPDNPSAKPTRTCTYYPGFVVKQIDLGEVGASELSIAPMAAQPPKCTAKLAGETVISSEVWSGYFKGAKGDFVFFDGDDGWNGGMPFAVFSKAGKKLFDDVRKGDGYAAVDAGKDNLTIRYTRVWPSPCSLMADAEGCWKKIVAATSLSQAKRPDCTAAYRKEMARTPKFAKQVPDLHTVISYEAEARYANGKLTIAPRTGPVECWLPD